MIERTPFRRFPQPEDRERIDVSMAAPLTLAAILITFGFLVLIATWRFANTSAPDDLRPPTLQERFKGRGP